MTERNGTPAGSTSVLALALTLALVGCGGDPGDQAARETPPAAAADTEPTLADKRTWDGAKIYDEVCDQCHKMGFDGAPELDDAEAWAPRVAKDRETLYDHVLNGFNKMPARGECDFCTDEQLRAAMRYMLDNNAANAPG